jgi:DNA primase
MALQLELWQSDQAAFKAQVVVNAPLNFALKNLNADHFNLVNRGLTKEAIACFGLGYCSKGLLSGRIAIPIPDRGGKLIGYTGRIADDTHYR